MPSRSGKGRRLSITRERLRSIAGHLPADIAPLFNLRSGLPDAMASLPGAVRKSLAWKSDALSARAALLRTDELQQRLEALVTQRASAYGPVGSDEDRQGYWAAVAELSAATDEVLDSGTLDRYVREWDARKGTIGHITRAKPSSIAPAFDGVVKARFMLPDSILLAVESIRRHVGGETWAEADEHAADAAYGRTASDVGVYRGRVRARVKNRQRGSESQDVPFVTPAMRAQLDAIAVRMAEADQDSD